MLNSVSQKPSQQSPPSCRSSDLCSEHGRALPSTCKDPMNCLHWVVQGKSLHSELHLAMQYWHLSQIPVGPQTAFPNSWGALVCCVVSAEHQNNILHLAVQSYHITQNVIQSHSTTLRSQGTSEGHVRCAQCSPNVLLTFHEPSSATRDLIRPK